MLYSIVTVSVVLKTGNSICFWGCIWETEVSHIATAHFSVMIYYKFLSTYIQCWFANFHQLVIMRSGKLISGCFFFFNPIHVSSFSSLLLFLSVLDNLAIFYVWLLYCCYSHNIYFTFPSLISFLKLLNVYVKYFILFLHISNESSFLHSVIPL